MDGYYKSCSSCGNPLQFSDSRCKWCNQLIATDDFEDWVYSQFEDNTHMLHGVVHSNGYGHLLTVNGREGGSNVLSGSDIMNFWDRLCAALSVRSGPIDYCFGIIFSWILVDKDLHWLDSILFGIIVMEYISFFFSSNLTYKIFSPNIKDGGLLAN
ncbi:hypothetical protein SLEP1_g43447 [Rubroshorea leprosula]|nr:hypothetical protein SLEP1_g43447 [Rubroshorea leprosula]